MEGKAINAALMAVQRDLKAPKSNTNSFGKYRYRSCEDILEAVKPLLNENGLVLLLGDTIEQIGSRYYVKATATLIDVATGDAITNTALAREPEEKKGSDASQVTGAASSYARKYCLNGLFAIDDTKDPDTDEYRRESQNRAGASGNGNANNVPRNGGNGAQTGAQAAKTANDPYDRKHLNARLMEEFQRTGASSAEMTAVIKAKYGKDSAKALSELDLKDLCDNLETYLAELMQKQAG